MAFFADGADGEDLLVPNPNRHYVEESSSEEEDEEDEKEGDEEVDEIARKVEATTV